MGKGANICNAVLNGDRVIDPWRNGDVVTVVCRRHVILHQHCQHCQEFCQDSFQHCYQDVCQNCCHDCCQDDCRDNCQN